MITNDDTLKNLTKNIMGYIFLSFARNQFYEFHYISIIFLCNFHKEKNKKSSKVEIYFYIIGYLTKTGYKKLNPIIGSKLSIRSHLP
jgi:hypothetical protein